MSKFYSLSLLVSLNARDSWRRETTASHSASGGVGSAAERRINGRTPRSLNVNMLRSADRSKHGVSSRSVTPGYWSTTLMHRRTCEQPQQIYIDVEAHEMVVVDEDVKSGHSYVTPSPSQTHSSHSEKRSNPGSAFHSDVERGL